MALSSPHKYPNTLQSNIHASPHTGSGRVCVQVQRGEDGEWNDLSCDVGLPFVCQVDAKLQHTGRY